MFPAAVPQKRGCVVQMRWSALVDTVSLLFLSPEVVLLQDCASACTLQELEAQSLFTGAQGINSWRDKTTQDQQHFPA